MFITVGTEEYELSTKLRVSKDIEKKFQMSFLEIFEKITRAEIHELLSILAIAAGKTGDASFYADIENEWDYMELLDTVQRLIAKLMYSGTPEQVEVKLDKHPGGEPEKNFIRGMLGLPKKEIPDGTGNN